MEILDNTSDAYFAVGDDLLNFTLDDGEVEEETESTIFKGGASASSSSSMQSSNPRALFVRGTRTGSFPEFVEEELEWLSNKDAFPAVETCFGILSDNPELISNHQSPVSILENNSTVNSNTNSSSITSCCNSLKVPTNHPVRARTKRRRRMTGLSDLLPSKHRRGPGQVRNVIKSKRGISFSSRPATTATGSGGGNGRRCLHCQVDKTPQWRAGPMGPKTLCNACGVRFKSGRLLPEYRPANSPTFSSVLHSNSHRKVVEMRRRKEMGVDASFGHSVG